MPRRRGNLFAGSYDEELREAITANPNFAQVPNCRGRYASTRNQAAAAAAAAAPDSSDPLYTPTASAERAETDGADSPAPAARSPRRSKRLRSFYVDREVEPASASRRTRATRELVISGETVRELRIQVSSSSDSEGSARSLGRGGARRSTRSAEFADDNFPSTNTSAHRIRKSPESEAHCASVSTDTTPRAHRRKQSRPYRCPVV